MPRRYSLTPEHRAQLAPWAERWIANATSTAPMSDADRAEARACVAALYRAAGLTPPPPHRIVFVPSPVMGAVVAGLATWEWYCRAYPEWRARPVATDAATRAATDAATYDATYAATAAATAAATYAATDAATDAATRAATAAATYDATDAATRAATDAATYDATAAATRAATYAATDAATDAATRAATDAATYAATAAATAAADNWYHAPIGAYLSVARALHGAGAAHAMRCANRATWSMRNGGNQWSAWVAFVSFFRHIAKLPIDYTAWAPYERLAEISGPRYLHPEFAVVCDRPEVLTVDAQRRPHGEAGPFCRWRDGVALYAWHGVRVPADVIEAPARLLDDGARRIQQEPNAEVRRVMIDRVGHGAYVQAIGATRVQADDYGELYRVPRPDDDDLVLVKVRNSTREPDGSYRDYWLRVPPATTSAHEGVAWTWGRTRAEYAPGVET